VKHLFRIRLALVLAGIAVACLAGTWAIGAVQDKHEVARVTGKMKTVCVGRFLVDLPEEAKLELTRPRVDGFDIEVFDESNDGFEIRLTQREAQLRGTPDRLGGDKNLESVKDVRHKNGVTGKIFVHGRTVTEGQASDGLTIERYRYEGVAIEALVHAGGISIDFSTDYYDPESLGNLEKLIAQLVPNPGSRVPSEPGFCLDRAYIRDPLSADQREQIMMAAWLPSRPDIAFRLMLAAGTAPDEQGLLERGAESNARMAPGESERVTRIHGEKRTISGLEGEELIEQFVEENDAVVYSFWWELNGSETDVMVPHVAFTMDTGNGKHGPVPSSLSQGAATGLWELISSSLRLRPAIQQAAVVEGSSTTSIGAFVYAGDICPQCGWWECGEGGNGVSVLGGQRQYVKQGEPMPQALLLPAPTLWERLRGLQPSFESPNRTSWRLVDKRNQQRITPALPLAKAGIPGAGGTDSANSVTQRGRPQHISVGRYAVTGASCPASGWWQCEDSHALDGTRWFAEGSLLPPATFALPASVFGRSANAPKAIQRRGAWRLVRLAASVDHLSSRDADVGIEGLGLQPPYGP